MPRDRKLIAFLGAGPLWFSVLHTLWLPGLHHKLTSPLLTMILCLRSLPLFWQETNYRYCHKISFPWAKIAKLQKHLVPQLCGRWHSKEQHPSWTIPDGFRVFEYCCDRFCLEVLCYPFGHGCFKTEVKHAQNATTTTTNKGSMSISTMTNISQVCCQSPKGRCLHCSTSSDWSSERSAHDSNPPAERFGLEGNLPNLPGLCILKRVSRFRAMVDVFLWNLAKLWYMDLTLLLLQWKYGFISVYAALCTSSLHAIPAEQHPSKFEMEAQHDSNGNGHTSYWIIRHHTSCIHWCLGSSS